MKKDIIEFSDGLIQRLKEHNQSEENNTGFTWQGKTAGIVRDIIGQLRQFTLAYSFKDEAEEIRFFKESKPVLLSQYYYSRKKFSILLFDSFSDSNGKKDNYAKQLGKMQRFALKHKEFYQYCISGQQGNDRNYFLRSDDTSIEFDDRFSTGYDTILAKLLANELLKDFITTRILVLETEKASHVPLLNWTDSKVGLIELIYALHVSGTINNSKSEIKQIVTAFQQLFGIDLGNYARVFAEIRIRKNGQTTFLDRIRENLVNRIEEFDK